MNKLLLFTLISFCSLNIISQGCLPEGVIFTTQAQIDNFQIDNPGCNEIFGNVLISGEDIYNLNGLNVLVSIGGNLLIESNGLLTDLTGLENLETISGSLLIGNLYFGSYPYCIGNLSLTSLAGLNGLNQVEGNLEIYCNSNLSTLSGLENLESVEGDIRIGSIDYIYGFTFGNESLVDCSGLNNLASIGGIFSIAGNDNLAHLEGLDSLASIGGNFMIAWNGALKDFAGLNQLTTIGGSLDMRSNDSLVNLNGLENLTQLHGDLKIGGNYDGNPMLADLTALNSLSTLGGNLEIAYNAVLSDLSGLENIDAGSIENLIIRNNNSLSTCEVYSICQYLASPNGTIEIQDNAPGCNNSEEVMGSCDYSSITDFRFIIEVLFHPNPFATSTTIEYKLAHPQTIRIEFYNQLGMLVDVVEEYQRTGLNKIIWTPKSLGSGIYLVRFNAGKRLSTGKLLLMK